MKKVWCEIEKYSVKHRCNLGLDIMRGDIVTSSPQYFKAPIPEKNLIHFSEDLT